MRLRALASALDIFLQDVRFGLRLLRRNPGFACTAVLVLTLGIGTCVAFFAFVDSALLKPLPYDDPSRLVAVYEAHKLIPRSNLSFQDYLDWKKLNRVFSAFDVWTGSGYLFRTPAGMQTVSGARVTAGFFRTLGVTPALGRDFHEGEDSPNSPPAVMLSYSAWQSRFGGKPDVLGQPVVLDDTPYTIIGVLPRDFHFAPRGSAEFWAPIQTLTPCEKRRSCHNLYGAARLKDGVAIPTALADLKSIAAQLEQQYPDSNRGQSAALLPIREAIIGDIRPILLVLLGGAALLLLIACVNVSSLLLVRSESRRRELAVRGALGASPLRLISHFVTEGLVLVVAAGALGVALASWGMQLLLGLIPADMLVRMPYLRFLALNARVLAFAGVVCLFAGGLFSLVPTLRLSLTDLREDLAAGGRTLAGTAWRRLGANLVILELATAMVLLAGAGLLGKSLYRLLHVDLGFQSDHLATITVAAPDAAYAKDEQKVELGRRIQERVALLPGVESAVISVMLPVSRNGNTTWTRVVGHPFNGEHNEANERYIGSAYFSTLRAKLLRGRFFTDADDASKPRVVIINRTFERKYFPGEDPIGKTIGDNTLSPRSLMQVVGVVDDVREGALDAEIWPAVYEPYNQIPDTYFSVIVRTSQPEQTLLPTMAAVIHQIDSNIATLDPATMAQRINDSPSAWLHRSSAGLVGGFAALALLLGVVGLYGVIAYSVSQRTREIGVRVALGAQRSSVYQLILKEAGRLVAVGICAGVAGALAAASLMGKLLFGVRAWDISTLLAVAAVLAMSALLASYIPARRAASVNPVEALRAE